MITPNQEPSILTKDNDGHWYLVPCSKQSSFSDFVEASENDRDWSGFDFDACRISSPYHIRLLAWEEL